MPNTGYFKNFNLLLLSPSSWAFDTHFSGPGLYICVLAAWELWLWIMSQLSFSLGESTIIPDWWGWGNPLLPVPFQKKNIRQLEFRALQREFRQNIYLLNLASLDLFWFMIDWFLNCLFNPNDYCSRGGQIPRSMWSEAVEWSSLAGQIKSIYNCPEKHCSRLGV